MIGMLLRKKFAGVQQPLGRWIIRHVLELIVLSPAILITWLYLKIRKIEVLQIGESPIISRFIAPLEPELRRRQAIDCQLTRTIVLNLSEDANSFVRKMYDRVVKIYGSESKIKRRIIWWSAQLLIGKTVLVENQSDPLWKTGKPTVSFLPEEILQGDAFLKSIQIDPGSSFICYATRTESYYLARQREGATIKPRSTRNPDESVYLSVAEKYCGAGFPVLRMGKDLSTSLNIDINLQPKIFDYASSNRSDFLDAYLAARCKFIFTGATGIVWFRWLFNLPNVHGDAYDVRRTQIAGDLMIFQKVWLLNEKRLATVSEMLKMKSEYSDERHQARLGVELIKNTADEIFVACQEMNARIDGTWETTPEDEELQRRYLDLVVEYSDQPTWRGGGRVGTQFLRDNQDLLR